MGKECVPTFDIEHMEIHEGEHFFVTDIDIDIDAAGPKYWRITTPNSNTVMHFTFRVVSKDAAVIQLYENPTIDAAGTGLTIYNNNRNSSDTSTATVFKDTTITGEGTLLISERLASGVNGRGGGILNRANEIILKANEDYNIKVTSDGDNNEATIVMQFYEKGITQIF